LFLLKKARREARAMVAVALLGAGFGLAIGGSYLAGGLASAAANRATTLSVAPAAREGFSPRAFSQQTSEMDRSALAIAMRHDPVLPTPELEDGRRGLILIGRLGRSPGARLIRADIDAVGPAAEPFANASALQSTRDLDCLTTAVYFEARGESSAGQAAVAQVVLNRVRHPAYPRTICGVVFQGAGYHTCQFSFACNGAMHQRRDLAAWERARTVAERALSGSVMATIGNATNFHSTHVSPSWPGMIRVSQVGSHVFYRFAGRAGSALAFNARPSMSTGMGEATPNMPQTTPAALDASVRTSYTAASIATPTGTAAVTAAGDVMSAHSARGPALAPDASSATSATESTS
jgi:hypothetical protein